MEQVIKILNKKKLRILGLMSGTSLDGLDIALAEFDGVGAAPQMTVARTAFSPYPAELKRSIAAAFGGTTEQICRLNVVLAKDHSRRINEFLAEEPGGASSIDLIASHGQTIYHVSGHSTLQIVDADVIAQSVGVPVAHDFRMADVAVGGTGAPLVPVFDLLLGESQPLPTAFQNLGGIGNVTYVLPGRPEGLMAFDTGPANMLMDQLVSIHTNGSQSCDMGGSMAAEGAVDKSIVDKLLQNPYFQQKPPKSAGHENFGRAYVEKLMAEHSGVPFPTLLRTATRLVAESIARAYRDFLPQAGQVVFSGGGIRNHTLMAELKELLPDWKRIEFEDAFGFNPDFKEAAAFAYLGYCRCRNLPSNVPAATGAARRVCLGKLALPS